MLCWYMNFLHSWIYLRSTEFQVVNASSNFCIYFFAGKLFRLNLMKLLGRKPNLSPKTNGISTCGLLCREQSNGNYEEELQLKENKSDEHVCDTTEEHTANTNVDLKVTECDPPRRHPSLLITHLWNMILVKHLKASPLLPYFSLSMLSLEIYFLLRKTQLVFLFINQTIIIYSNTAIQIL